MSGIRSLIVRSSATAARFVTESPDLRAVASECDVDRVVMGTIMRAGDQLRVTAQLVEAPGGTLLSSHTAQSGLNDLFRLQDDIARRVVAALALPLRGDDPPPTPGVAPESSAYGLYLRANELARRYDELPHARELYQRCIDLDPRFAPAWARLGRCHWVIGKYLGDAADSAARAEEALRRALELNPSLSVAHMFYAQLESDTGHAPQALTRLLAAAVRYGNDPELFAGIVHAARYCGLNEQSVAAHEEARRLDPNVPTSLAQTLLMMGEFDRALSVPRTPGAGTGDDSIRVIALGLAGLRDEARRALIDLRKTARIPAFDVRSDYLMAWLERRSGGMRDALPGLAELKIMQDPEAIFQDGWLLCDVGDHARGLDRLREAVAAGYTVAPTLATSPVFDALRDNPAFRTMLSDAEAGRRRALDAFREAGGEQLLREGRAGPPVATPSIASPGTS